MEPEQAGIDQNVYGEPSGVMGFRLVSKSGVQRRRGQEMDGERYVNDPSYYNATSSFGRTVWAFPAAPAISRLPTHPPADPENPSWENLASAIGNQYIREGKVFAAT